MDEIQKYIINRGKRNVISRRYHAKDDEEAIATWRLDLDRILPAFNVRPTIPTRCLPTLCFQIELGVNTHAAGSGTHQDAANEHTIGSDVANTNTIMYRNKPKSREGADGKNQAVSITRTSQ